MGSLYQDSERHHPREREARTHEDPQDAKRREERAPRTARDMTDAELRKAWAYYDSEQLYTTPRWSELDAEYQRRGGV